MNFEVGQELLDGRVIVASVDDGAHTVTITFVIISGPTGPLQVVLRRDVTEAAIEAVLAALLAVVPGIPT